MDPDVMAMLQKSISAKLCPTVIGQVSFVTDNSYRSMKKMILMIMVIILIMIMMIVLIIMIIMIMIIMIMKMILIMIMTMKI